MTEHPHPAGYVKQPTLRLPDGAEVRHGARAWQRVDGQAGARAGAANRVIVVDAYPGTDLDLLRSELAAVLPEHTLLDVEQEAARPIAEIDQRIAHNLTDDRVFGVVSHARLDEFYDPERLAALAERAAGEPAVVLYGWGAALVPCDQHALVLVEMARWEIQQRMRAGLANWRCSNGDEDVLRKYKRGFFVEWKLADRHKTDLFDRADFVLDGSALGASDGRSTPAGMIDGADFRAALAGAAHSPFRVVPFFDPGVWGGQWMKEQLGLDPDRANYAWCFDCVPEENSLVLEGVGGLVEIPAMDLVLNRTTELLGERTRARFGTEFPIRFDFLDTVGGGNLSLQVHPLTSYIQDRFGMHFTQDESYYLLDAEEDAVVYLGLRNGVDPDAMAEDLRVAASGATPFPAEQYVNEFPARTHDHFSIPAGTVHCSGANSMVLEISATPFIFTFKLWDWGRVGLDGVPRPVHLDHGLANIQWDRDTDWVERELLAGPELVESGDGWREERTGLHRLEFLETRRHWFTAEVPHDTDGTVNVLNLVAGDEVVVSSPTGAFEPYEVHYAETFIVPAAVGSYTIRPSDRARSTEFATIKAWVRGTRDSD